MLDTLGPPLKPGGPPPKHIQRELVGAILSILRFGRAWRCLPHVFPLW